MFNYSPDLSVDNAVARSVKCIEKDEKVLDYFDVLTEFGDVFQNYRAIQGNDIARITNESPLPREVASFDQGKIGFLEEVNRFFCIQKNELVLWVPGSTITQRITEEETEIIAVASFTPCKNCFTEHVSGMLALSTPTYIRMYPFIDGNIDPATFYTQETDFSAFSLSAGPQHTLIAGSHCGDIYKISIQKNTPLLSKILGDDEVSGRIEPQISKASKPLASAIPEFLRFRSTAIIQICFDPTTNTMATLDDDSNLKFYDCGGSSIKKIGSYSPGQSKIVNICYIPLSDSKFMRFVAFNSQAQRLFFGYSKRIFGKSSSITLQYIKNPPPDFEGFELVSGAFSLGTTVLVFSTGVNVIRSTTNGLYEEVFLPSCIKCSGCLVYSQRHSLDELPTATIFKDTTMWQHIIDPPTFVLMNVDGTALIETAFPSENIYRSLTESHGGISEEVKMIIGENIANESIAAAILFAQIRPDSKGDIINALKLLNGGNTSFTESIFIRAGRFLGLINSLNPFANNNVSKEIECLPPRFISQIKGFVSLIQELIEYESDASQKSELSELCELLSVATEIITFIQIMGTQQSESIKKTLNRLSLHDKNRLLKQIGRKEPIISSLRNFLHEFVNAIEPSPELDLLTMQICKECQHIASYETIIKSEAESLLRQAAEVQSVERVTLLRQAASAYCEACTKYPCDMSVPIRRFIDLNAPELAVELAIAWRDSIDPYHRALDWFEAYCDKTDSEGFNAFQKVYKCYSTAIVASSTDKGLEAILNTDDKLFIYTALEYISADTSRLLSVRTPYLEGYLKDNKRKKLWLLYAKTDKSKAADELIHLAIDGTELSLKERIQFLTEAANLARQGGNNKLKQEARAMLDCAKLSIQLKPQPEMIMKASEVAKAAQDNEQYCLALEAYSLLKDIDACKSVWKEVATKYPRKAVDILKRLPHGIVGSDPNIIVPLLEDLRVALDESYSFVIGALVNASVNLNAAANIYLVLIANEKTDNKGSLICSALRLLSIGYGDREKLLKIAKDAEKDAKYGEEIKKLMP